MSPWIIITLFLLLGSRFFLRALPLLRPRGCCDAGWLPFNLLHLAFSFLTLQCRFVHVVIATSGAPSAHSLKEGHDTCVPASKKSKHHTRHACKQSAYRETALQGPHAQPQTRTAGRTDVCNPVEPPSSLAAAIRRCFVPNGAAAPCRRHQEDPLGPRQEIPCLGLHHSVCRDGH